MHRRMLIYLTGIAGNVPAHPRIVCQRTADYCPDVRPRWTIRCRGQSSGRGGFGLAGFDTAADDRGCRGESALPRVFADRHAVGGGRWRPGGRRQRRDLCVAVGGARGDPWRSRRLRAGDRLARCLHADLSESRSGHQAVGRSTVYECAHLSGTFARCLRPLRLERRKDAGECRDRPVASRLGPALWRTRASTEPTHGTCSRVGVAAWRGRLADGRLGRR